jgi:hypothetical protein
MFSHLRFDKIALVLAVSFAVIGCGKAGKSDDTKMSFNPARPIVITADATITADKKVTGPWFRVASTFTNNTDTPISLFALKMTTTWISPTGAVSTSETYILPSDANYSYASGDTSISCEYATFGTWTAGESRTITPLNSATGDCSQTISIWYLHGLSGGKDATNFRYKVEVEPIGWFGTESDAQDRYKKSFQFYTQ